MNPKEYHEAMAILHEFRAKLCKLQEIFAKTEHPKPFRAKPSDHLSAEVKEARAHFQKGGWSYRAAAIELGVSYQHICQVLRGVRESESLLAKIKSLPTRNP